MTVFLIKVFRVTRRNTYANRLAYAFVALVGE